MQRDSGAATSSVCAVKIPADDGYSVIPVSCGTGVTAFSPLRPSLWNDAAMDIQTEPTAAVGQARALVMSGCAFERT